MCLVGSRLNCCPALSTSIRESLHFTSRGLAESRQKEVRRAVCCQRARAEHPSCCFYQEGKNKIQSLVLGLSRLGHNIYEGPLNLATTPLTLNQLCQNCSTLYNFGDPSFIIFQLPKKKKKMLTCF